MKLIHFATFIRPGGGPGGYLFNLREGLKSYSDKDITIISMTEDPNRVPGFFNSRKHKFFKLLPSFLKKRILFFRERKAWSKPLPPQIIKTLTDAKGIVFHEIKLASRFFHSFVEPPKRKYFFLNHAPTSIATEIVERWDSSFNLGGGIQKLWKSILKLEIASLKQMNAIISPTKFSMEQVHREYCQVSEKVSLPCYEVVSGTKALQPKKSIPEMRETLNIKNGTLVVGFFGRYHAHKGFDVFLEIVEKWQSNSSVFFLSAGVGPITPNHNLRNYMNLGWQDKNLADLVNVCDVVIIPNRYAFFDLFLLEALSLGKIVLATKVGGNKFFEGLSPGIRLAAPNNPVEIQSELQNILNEQSEFEDYSKQNKSLYTSTFSNDEFSLRHINLKNVIFN